MITVIAGGVGAARFLTGLVQVRPPDEITAVVNVGDDIELHGLSHQPRPRHDHLHARRRDRPRAGLGPGRRDVAGDGDARPATAARTWFNLGDRDLGTHLYRTGRRREGAPLSQVTAEITAGWGLELALLPATDDPLRTMLTIDGDDGRPTEIGFQEYFVQRQHSVPVRAIRFDGADEARPAPGVLEAIDEAECVVIAPSNPLISIDPVLAVGGVRDAITAARERTVAVSPIVAGAALKGPADRLLAELGHDPDGRGRGRALRAAGVDAGDRRGRRGARPGGRGRAACAASWPPR